MIDLLIGDDRRSFGIVTLLAVAGIPARRITRASEFDGGVLVVAADMLDGAAAALARQVPTVVLGEGGAEGPPPLAGPLGLPRRSARSAAGPAMTRATRDARIGRPSPRRAPDSR